MLFAKKGRDNADGAACVGDINRLVPMVCRRDLYGRMKLARRRATDQERHIKALALHFCGNEDHFVETWRDEPGKANDVGLELFPPCRE